MFGGGLRPIRLAPINRGCVNTIVFLAVDKAKDGTETWIDKTDKKLYLTAKTEPWDMDATDSDAVFFPFPQLEVCHFHPGSNCGSDD